MPRILYWNIENFSVNKFWQPNRKRNRAGFIVGGPFTQEAEDRFDYFRQVLDNLHPIGTPASAARTPEIIVIVELESGIRARGNLVTTNGRQTARLLTAEVRNLTGNANWMVVPPVYTGVKEGVIVLYDSTNLIFTGPDVWPGGTLGPAAPPPAGPYPPVGPLPGPASPYPVVWHNFIRTGAGAAGNRPIPAGSLYNTNLWENQMAARVAGYTSTAGVGLAPVPGGMPGVGAAMDGNLGPRTPYMTTFFRPALGLAPAENITLFAIHSPAAATAHNYFTALACTQQIANPPVGNERKVVVGDFNFNLFTNAFLIPQRYLYFQQIGYTIGVAPVGVPPVIPAPPPPLDGYFQYFATHLAKVKKAINWSDNFNVRFYPTYGYLSDRHKCIDNIFVNGGALANTTVLNAVVGSPYNIVPGGGAPPWLTPAVQGFFDIDTLCPIYNAAAPTWQAPQFAVGMRAAFRGWNNFGRIRSTSDHLPIIADF